MKIIASKKRRTPFTKEILLPLPATRGRALALENHLAFSTLRAGQGEFFQMGCLLRAIYLAYFIDIELARPTAAIFATAEQVLARSVVRWESGEGWSIGDNEWQIIASVLDKHDRQVARVPRHIKGMGAGSAVRFHRR